MNPVSWILSYVASKTLRNYIAEIDYEQVQSGLFTGNFALQSVTLQKIKLPGRLVATGTIGSISVQVPSYKNFRTVKC
jgi:hypothetical protein